MSRRSVQLLMAATLLLGVAACSPPEPEEEVAAADDASAEPETAEVEAAEPVRIGPVPSWDAYVEEVEPAVRAWASAWSNQDVSAYLSHYSPSFRPPGGMSRVDWEMQRKTRLTRPRRIAVRIEDFFRTGSGTKWRGGRELEVVKVQFRQTYESDTYADEVTKQLELEHLDGRWQITDETSG